jgi:cysteine sulfinate desulfinase/cysteine desulfurase-like protein
MNRIQIPKGQNPLRLPFASFRLIFGLEKTDVMSIRAAKFGGFTGIGDLTARFMGDVQRLMEKNTRGSLEGASR